MFCLLSLKKDWYLFCLKHHAVVKKIKNKKIKKTDVQTCVKKISVNKIIKPPNILKEIFMFLFLFLNSSFFSSLTLNKYIYIMFIMSNLCPSLHFFTKRNDREKKKRKEKKKRRNIHRNISVCRVAMIMKFSTHSDHYIYLLLKRHFQSLR